VATPEQKETIVETSIKKGQQLIEQFQEWLASRAMITAGIIGGALEERDKRSTRMEDRKESVACC